ncbi:MAG: hypothetical protein HYY55_02555 [Candidatus Niyogibacteria bacterium]|nr:MAG: hypothetical protein HYY55_02555 [Candidatus Niyogibacteria bacterium]
MNVEKQVAKLIARIAENLPSMGRADRQRWIDDPVGLQEFLRGLIPHESDLLKFVESVAVEGADDRFVVDDRALEEADAYAESSFDRLFRGKVEEGIPRAELNVHELKKASVDGPILKELGDKNEICLFHFLKCLKGRRGWHFAYIRGYGGKLCVVGANRYDVDGCWRVEALSVGSPGGWFTCSRVVSGK